LTVTGAPDDPAWSPRQSALLRAVDELHADALLSDPAWAGLREHLDEPEALEFLVLAGWYRTIAYVANGVRIEPEPWARPARGVEPVTGRSARRLRRVRAQYARRDQRDDDDAEQRCGSRRTA
jgi:hypothetical protein